MKYVIEISLQQMTLVKIATQLWNQVYINNSISNIKFSQNCIYYEKIENQVVKNVSYLPIPKSFKKDLICLIGYIDREIRAWCTFHQEARCQILRSPTQLIWTSRGTIDRKETAEMLVKDKDLDIDLRYKLACIYCLEKEISEIWKQFPKLHKAYFCIKKGASSTKARELVRFWSCHLVGKMSMLEDVILEHTRQSNPHVYALQLAVHDGNLAATEFFINKLSDQEKNTLLVKYAVKASELYWCPEGVEGSFSEVFHFLLTQMSEYQQVQTLTTSTINSFQCFLEWPLQPFFMASAKLIAHLIPENNHVWILDSIIWKIINGCTDFDYQQLCRDYWRQIPLAYQRRFVSETRVIFQLLECGEDGIFSSILKHADSSEKENLMLNQLYWCVQLVDREQWQSIEKLIELCGASKEMMVRFKESLMDYDAKRGVAIGNVIIRRRWEAFSHFIDNLIEKKSQKRIAETDDENSNKKLRTY